ncbi:hypothetical protein BB560_002973 [Smittium megazygosporum]|uniref:Spp2/MOS2 G-patch domain-containing protein n=1 Tax=Smittium megazygosporum TaxID=133381 RepID=A0A2T9ZDD7_9FUNG|nr:hypothetical protein BB560_002973 [Smittium megazygosporum]
MKKFQQKRPLSKPIGGFSTLKDKDSSRGQGQTEKEALEKKIQFQIFKKNTTIDNNSKKDSISRQFGFEQAQESVERIAINEIQGNKYIRTDGMDENQKRIIKVEKNENWIQARIKKNKTSDTATPEQKTLLENQNTEIENSITYGLNISKKTSRSSETHKRSITTQKKMEIFSENISTTEEKLVSLEEQAISELLNEKPNKEMVIETISSQKTFADREQRAFHHDLELLPEESTEDDYERVPVAEFGEALLRGMGWSGDHEANKRHKKENIRPSLLGLGAKPAPPELNRKINRRPDNMTAGSKR